MAKIAIIGAGIAGLSVAYELIKHKDVSVDVYSDSSKKPASLVATGLIASKGKWNVQDSLLKLKTDGAVYFVKWIKNLNKDLESNDINMIPYHLGCFERIHDEDEIEYFYNRVFSRNFNGISVYEKTIKSFFEIAFKDKSELTHKKKLENYIYFPYDISVDVVKLHDYLTSLLIKKYSVKFIDQEVLDIDSNESWVLNKNYKYDHVVLALGSGLPGFIKSNPNLELNYLIDMLTNVHGSTLEIIFNKPILNNFSMHVRTDAIVSLNSKLRLSDGLFNVENNSLMHNELKIYSKNFSNLIKNSLSGNRLKSAKRFPICETLKLNSGKRLNILGALYKNGYSFGPLLANKLASNILKTF